MEGIEVHFEPKRGYLELSCGSEAFARLRDALVEASEFEVPIDGIRLIVVEEIPRIQPAGRLRDRLALVGCGILATAVVFVFAVGVATIASWMVMR